MAPLLSVKDLTLRRDGGTGSALFANVSFEVNDGDIIVLKGRSGSGKTTLLKCLAQLTIYQKGEVLFRGQEPKKFGIPNYRTKVLYIPQRPSLLPGTPTDFLSHIQTFASRRSQASSPSSSSWLPSFLSKKQDIALEDDEDYSKDEGLDPYELAKSWDVERGLWSRGWGDLSGGEGQRIALACALARGNGLGSGGEIVLLDEPTSALDPETSKLVEETLLSLLPPSHHNPSGKGTKNPGGGPKAYILITHSAEQAERLAGKGAKVVHLGNGEDTPPAREEENEHDEERENGGGKKPKKSSSSRV